MTGTGFVNIQQYLDANKGAGADVQQAAGGALSAEDARLSGNYNTTAAGVGKAFASSPQALNADQANAMLTGKNGGVSALQGATSWNNVANAGGPDFTGAGQQTLTGLGNAATTGRTLAGLQNPNATGGYTPQLDAIDRAIYGQGQAQGAVGNVGTQQAAQQGKYTGEYAALNAGIDRGNAASGGNAAANKGTLGGIRNDIVTAAQGKADAANKAQDQTIGAGPGQFGGQWQAGSASRATAGNFLGGDTGRLSAIGQILGDSGPKFAGNFTAGHYGIDPQKVADSLKHGVDVAQDTHMSKVAGIVGNSGSARAAANPNQQLANSGGGWRTQGAEPYLNAIFPGLGFLPGLIRQKNQNTQR